METGQHQGGLFVDLSPAWSDLSTLIVLPHLFRSGPLWLTAGKHIVQAMPSVYALQCLTGSLVWPDHLMWGRRKIFPAPPHKRKNSGITMPTLLWARFFD